MTDVLIVAVTAEQAEQVARDQGLAQDEWRRLRLRRDLIGLSPSPGCRVLIAPAFAVADDYYGVIDELELRGFDVERVRT